MRNSAFSTAVLAIAATLLMTSPPSARGEEVRYHMKPGDTLIGLGYRLLRDPGDWREVRRINRIKDPYRIPVGSTLRIPEEMLNTERRTARVVTSTGESEVNGQPAAPGTLLGEGDRLHTGEGHVILRLPDGSKLVLPARSEARMERLRGYRGMEGTEVGIGLERGRVESQVQPQNRSGARYRVDTPTAVIGVRGTGFRVATDGRDGASRAEVTKGRVAVSGTGRRAAATAVDAGYGLVVSAAGEVPPTPVKLLPAPATEGLPTLFQQPVVSFTPPPLEGAEGWRVQVTVDRPDAPVLADRPFTREQPIRIAGLEDGDYLLLIRGIDTHGLEGHDATHPFRLKARPEPPFLSAPVDGAKVNTGASRLRWTGAPEAARYRLRIGTDESLATPQVAEDALTRTDYDADLPPGTYYWRMASVRDDGDVGPWSPTARFIVRPLPDAPQAAVLDEDSMHFRWNGEAQQRFEYQLADDRHFANVVAEGEVAQPRVTLPLPVAGAYWLRVRSIDPDGFTSPWSGAQKSIVPSDFEWWLVLTLLFAL
ncbi:FecR family protein [Endothiovibrio diazotrophicus]